MLQQIGTFRIERELGRGGMGEVYLAHDTRLDRRVAIKALPEALAADPDRLARFQREAKVLASLNHPHIGGIYGLEEHSGRQYLILEFVEGETLAESVKRGPLPMEEALGLAKQIAEALEAAHDKGVIHRDIKPGNVMVTSEGAAKVLDFGLARTSEGAPSTIGTAGVSDSPTLTTPYAPVHSPTIPGAIMGSAGYMSPEQARGKPLDKRSDIFSFGCVLYEMLTGAGPFVGETVTDSLGAILHREPDWARLPPGTPHAVRLLVKRCMAKDRNQRLHDIADARIELQGEILDPASSLIQQGGALISGRPGRRREGVAWSLAALFALGTGAAWLVARHQRVPPGPSAFRQLNIRPEAVFRAAFAPDGKTAVYSAAGSGNTPELFVVRPESPEPQALGMTRTHLLSVSSRGELAVLKDAEYLGHRLFAGTLARVPLGGGAPRPLLERVREADWAPDGERLAIIREVDGKDRLEFPIGNVLRESPGYFSDLRFNPAGSRIAYFEHPFKYDNRGSVNAVDLNGRARVLAGDYWGMEGIAWSPDGHEVLYCASVGGEGLSVFGVTEDGVVRAVHPIPGGSIIHDVNREGRWLITQDTSPNRIIVRAPGFDRERDLSWLGDSWKGVLSKDGRTLVFTEGAASMGPNYGVCVRGVDGSPVLRLGEGSVQDLSSDGKWVLAIVSTSPPALIAYPVGPGDPVRLERAGLGSYWTAQWFGDGSRVLVNAAEPGKGLRFYIQEVKGGGMGGGGGAPRPVTPEGVRGGRLTSDERGILARGPAGAYAIYPIDGGEPRPVSALTEVDQLLKMCVGGASVLTYRPGPVPCTVERVDLESGRREPLLILGPADLAGVVQVFPTFVSDDLKSYIYGCTRYNSKLFVTDVRR